ncbi:unnamed protein product [Rotaria socialis]|uniref:SEC63 domain-containing protein n=1 Tax=Rotaria socialis TaxID=392032 RepID=A0A821BWL3_9BILA|nr:unnamed protein product [Rotaria socialis]
MPAEESVDEPSEKIKILLQAYTSQIKLDDYALMADIVYITQSAKIPKEIIRKIEKKNISWGTFYDLDAREIDVNNKMVEEQEVPNIELYLESNRLSLKLSIRRNANGQYITPVEENDQ